ncbi:hypothetical protein DMB42_21875 [Nonomuraea sp. WAC 01424]|nr:hypothetical protein DMB42_21875 [Nonomuraea sp. WAC 01424]
MQAAREIATAKKSVATGSATNCSASRTGSVGARAEVAFTTMEAAMSPAMHGRPGPDQCGDHPPFGDHAVA